MTLLGERMEEDCEENFLHSPQFTNSLARPGERAYRITRVHIFCLHGSREGEKVSKHSTLSKHSLSTGAKIVKIFSNMSDTFVA